MCRCPRTGCAHPASAPARLADGSISITRRPCPIYGCASCVTDDTSSSRLLADRHDSIPAPVLSPGVLFAQTTAHCTPIQALPYPGPCAQNDPLLSSSAWLPPLSGRRLKMKGIGAFQKPAGASARCAENRESLRGIAPRSPATVGTKDEGALRRSFGLLEQILGALSCDYLGCSSCPCCSSPRSG